MQVGREWSICFYLQRKICGLFFQDLVAWVTLGFYHIPHTEDVPNTPTVGTETSVLLLPFNYFPEDPSMGSRDAVRAEWNQGRTSFSTYGTLRNVTCMPRTFPWFQGGSF